MSSDGTNVLSYSWLVAYSVLSPWLLLDLRLLSAEDYLPLHWPSWTSPDMTLCHCSQPWSISSTREHTCILDPGKFRECGMPTLASSWSNSSAHLLSFRFLRQEPVTIHHESNCRDHILSSLHGMVGALLLGLRGKTAPPPPPAPYFLPGWIRLCAHHSSLFILLYPADGWSFKYYNHLTITEKICILIWHLTLVYSYLLQLDALIDFCFSIPVTK